MPGPDHHVHGSVRRPQVLDLQLAHRALHAVLFDVLEQMANDLIQQLLRAENLHPAPLGRASNATRAWRDSRSFSTHSPRARSVPTGSVRASRARVPRP